MSDTTTVGTKSGLPFLGVSLAALGVVFGDIGTSPLYALRQCFHGPHAIQVTPDNVLGAVSLIFWFLIIIVTLKYIVFVMHADNKGEGGVLSLMALVHRRGPGNAKILSMVTFLGIIGTAFLFSDGIITPSISVLSAIEGLSIVTPSFEPYIIPIALLILCGLFSLQPRGTGKIGALFGPILVIWFLAIGVLGVLSIVKSPGVLACFNPLFAAHTLIAMGWKSLALLATAFLAVTGVEVLYADMGHFGRHPIRAIWFALVLPALVLNYLGQAAFLLRTGSCPLNLFYSIVPQQLLIPGIVLATIATIIASQAVIAGMFSLAKQAVQLGFWPRIRVIYTSLNNPGQVYLPFINIALFCATAMLVLNFRSSSNLASAYGIAVSADMLITTTMLLILGRSIWKIHPAVLYPLFAGFMILDLLLFAGNMTKLPTGGWVVIGIATGMVILITSWTKGRALLGKKIESAALPMKMFIDEVGTLKPNRIKGTAVFLSGSMNSVPNALLHNFKHNQALHEQIIILSVRTEDVPFVSSEHRAAMIELGSNIHRLFLKFGFMETPDIPSVLRTISAGGKPIDPMQVSYFLGKESLILSNSIPMVPWRKKIFMVLSRNSISASSFYKLPPNRVVEFGSQIEF